MARIQAGNTLVNQYAPPFVVSDNVTTGWELRWNDTLKAFEAYDPSASIIEGGFSSIESSIFLATRQQVFVVLEYHVLDPLQYHVSLVDCEFFPLFKVAVQAAPNHGFHHVGLELLP